MVRKRKLKLFVSLFLVLVMLCGLCVCGDKQGTTEPSVTPGASGAPVTSSSVTPASEDSEFAVPSDSDEPGYMRALGTYGDAFEEMKAQTLELPADYAELAEAIIELRNYGLDLLSGDLALQAEYAITLSESYATAVRYACDLILANRGVTFENVGLFSDWNQIKHLSLVSTMPYLMQGICQEDAGDVDGSQTTIDWYTQMDNPVPCEDNLKKLSGASTDVLKALREALANYECDIYTFYPVVPGDEELNGYECLTSYHLLVAQTYMEQELYPRALESYEDAVRTYPFDAEIMAETAWCAICAGDMHTALNYIDNGILFDPDNGEINLMAALFFAAAGDKEASASYLDHAMAAGLTDSQEEIAAKVDAFLKGGN